MLDHKQRKIKRTADYKDDSGVIENQPGGRGSQSGKSGKGSSVFSIPETGKPIPKPVIPAPPLTISNDSMISIPPTTIPTKPMDQSSLNIPRPSTLGGSTSTIEDKIISGEGLQSLSAYKEFNPVTLLVKGKLETRDVFQAFAFLVCELLFQTEAGEEKLIDIKDRSFLMHFDQNLYESQFKLIRTHGGDDISDYQIKRLFLEYVMRIFEKEQSVPIIENYYVLADILTMTVREYVRLNIGSSAGAQFELAIQSQKADQIYPFYSEPLGITYARKGGSHVFGNGDKQLIIEETKPGLYRSWIE